MDILYLAGMFLAFFMMVFGIVFVADVGIVFGNLSSFVDIPSLAITVFGTFAVLLMSFNMADVMSVPKQLKMVVMPPKNDPLNTIKTISEFAKEARIKGLLSLDSKLQECDDDYLRRSMQLIVDAVDAEKVRQILETELSAIEDRHNRGMSFYLKGASYAPAFGMIGTLIGLINMLKAMDDPSAIGPAMAVALLTTLYGSFLANVLFNPIATKLKLRHDDEMLCKSIICEGVFAIQAGENPRFIEEKLLLMLDGKERKKFDSAAASNAE